MLPNMNDFIADYEVHMNMVHKNPSTTVMPMVHTSGAHTKGAKMTPSASWDDQQSNSSGLSVSEKDMPETQAFSNTTTTTAGAFIICLICVCSFGLQTFANAS